MNRWAAITLILFVGAQTACSLGKTAATAQCYNDTVQTSPGVILPLNSGQTYQVYPTDNHISMNWLPTDKVIVCPIGGAAVEITNTSERGQKIHALQIFNFGWYVWPP